MTRMDLIEKGIDMERGQEKVQQILNGDAKDTPAAKQRAKHSDAGTKRPAKAKASAEPGVLTETQILQIQELIAARDEARDARLDAEADEHNADTSLLAYLTLLQAKP